MAHTLECLAGVCNLVSVYESLAFLEVLAEAVLVALDFAAADADQ